MSKVVHIGTDMELDPSFGSPMSPNFPGAQVQVKFEQGRDLTGGGDGKPYPLAIVQANRAGLLQLGYRMVAMAHACPDAEELYLHFHVPSDLPDLTGGDVQAGGGEVIIELVPSKDE